MDYGEVLTKAGKIIWKHKILWIFGIFAGFGQGGGGSINSSSRFSSDSSSFNGLPPEITHFFNNFTQTIESIPWWGSVLIGSGFFALILVIVALSIFGEVGLVRGTKFADNSDEKLRFATLFEGSKRYFWRVFWFNFLAGVVIIFLVMLFFIPSILLMVASHGGVNEAMMWGGIGLFFILICCLFVPICWLVGIIMKQTVNAIVIEDVGILQGLKLGWQVCRRHPGPMLVMALILMIGGGVVNFILSIPIILAMLPIAIPFISGNMQSLTSAATISILLCCLYLPVYYLLFGIVTAYTQSAWALVYLRLTCKPNETGVTPLEVLPELPPTT